jgi:hypothetical protein
MPNPHLPGLPRVSDHPRANRGTPASNAGRRRSPRATPTPIRRDEHTRKARSPTPRLLVSTSPRPHLWYPPRTDSSTGHGQTTRRRSKAMSAAERVAATGGVSATLDASMSGLHVRCMACGAVSPGDRPLTACPVCGGLLDVMVPIVGPIDPASFGRGLPDPLAHSGVWRYRPLLPAIPDEAVVTRGKATPPSTGTTASPPGPGWRPAPSASSTKGTTHRFVQGPRDDGRGLPRQGGRRPNRGLRQHRQHLRLARLLRRLGGDARARPRPGRQDQRRQAGPDDRLRRDGGPGRRATSTSRSPCSGS